jgi:DNA-binding transcriptional MocR family regulator
MELELDTALGEWGDGDGPLYQRLAGAIAAAIRRGELLAGTRLPPERALAVHLGVGRGTVAAAYELLSEQGVIDRRQGRGTEITGGDGTLVGARAAELATAFQRNVLFRSIAEPAEETVDLLASCAPPSPPVLAAITAATRAVDITELACDNGYHPLGHPPLRQAVAAHLTGLGQPTVDEEVLITSGAQQAISLLAACYVQPGKLVVLEDPTFPGAVDAFRAAGARILTVPVRETGPDIDLLGTTLTENAVQVVYLTPTFQNPTGAVISESDRREIVRLSRLTGVPIIEDNAVAELSFGGQVPPSMGTLAGDAPILSIGSLSKLFWGGLRIGWIRGPRQVIAHLGRLKAVSDLGTSLVSQSIATGLLADVDRIRAVRCGELSERLDLLASLLETLLPDWQWRRPSGGLSVWTRLPSGNAAEFAHCASRLGVSIVPGPIMSATGSCEQYVRLPFDHEPPVLREGVNRLATAWATYSSALARRTGQRLHLVI